jgi:hypothetical protein
MSWKGTGLQYSQYQIIAEAEENPQGDSFFIVAHPCDRYTLSESPEPIGRIQHLLFLLRLVRKRKPRKRRG